MGKGKYADIIDDLPRSWGTEPEYQKKVEELKTQILTGPGSDLPTEAIEDMLDEIQAYQHVLNAALTAAMNGKRHASHLARIYHDLRMVKAAYHEQEKITNMLLEAYDQLLVTQYEVEGIKSLTIDSGETIRVEYQPHATVTDKDENRKWAIENGLENLLSIPWQTLNALTKEALLKGEPEPDGVTAESWTTIKVQKA